MDYDALEDNWYKLRQAKVLVADYDLLRHDFPFLCEKAKPEINTWLLDNAAYISEGQVKRILTSGDLHDVMDDPSASLDTSDRRVALRMKGGGRAATFFVDSKYWFDPESGFMSANMIEVKGCGTSILHTSVTTKACGLLSLVDALKEFAYEKLLRRISVLEKSSWSTVGYYAVVDTGLRFKDDKPNPATGYLGDRCSLCMRQRQSRMISTFDEVVYYSVARHKQLLMKTGMQLRKDLTKYHVSSEQIPLVIGCENFEELLENLEGNWNVQCDASFGHLVDFSHWYVLPDSLLPGGWKISEEGMARGFKLGGRFLGLFQNKSLMKRIYSMEDVDQVKQIWEKEKHELQEQFSKWGTVGQIKPTYSWSWFLEVDDSEVMKWAIQQGMTFNGSAEDDELMNFIESNLPKGNTRKVEKEND
eukprot:TRINITY_DN10707_c0_g2_i1.p1 TRINITY_DN10707_c0_g2~~TRINITY_DN10707_c0_g2_i1.p1  ORF type:complete len:460 (+),score=109.55 TRINITY_DN10707_c0_g2_i1:128-1381(+)